MMPLVRRLGLFALTAAVVASALMPFGWAVVTSLRPPTEIFEASWIVTNPTLGNYRNVLGEAGFLTSVLNSLIVAGLTTVLALAIALLSGFSLSRIPFRGRTTLLLGILSVSMFPQVAILSGLFELVRRLGLYNDLRGLTLCYLALVLPFTVWVLRGFLKGVPREIEEAAILDGCSPLKILFRVFLPLLRPAIATTGILSFIAAWNEFLFALTLTISPDQRTVPVTISMLSGASQYDLPWGNVMAASVVVTLPLVVLVLIFQKHIVAGLTSGAVKG